MTPPVCPPGHQPALFIPGGGAPPRYRVLDRDGRLIAATFALGAAVVRARALAAVEGWAWVSDTSGGTARFDVDGAVTTPTPDIAWTATITTKEQP